jgi:hypothetical protein
MGDLLPRCTRPECGHLARDHGDRASGACAPETSPPRINTEGKLIFGTRGRCLCTGYRAVPM